MSNTADKITERDLRLLKYAMQSMEDADVKIDIAKFAALGGFSTLPSARTAWYRLRVKLGVVASATPITVTSTESGQEVATPTPKKRKRSANAPPSPTAEEQTPSTKKRAKKVAKSVLKEEKEQRVGDATCDTLQETEAIE